MSEEQELLKEWCDRLVSLQITEWNDKEFYGGIMCPSCGRIHGRCSDAMYPMMYMAKETGDSKYLDCARRLFAWSSNMFRRDGCCYNDTNSNWRGITVFSEIQLGEALLAFGDLLDKEEYTVWKDRFQEMADYLYLHIEEIGGNINYPITCAYAMAVAAKLLKDKKYSQKGRTLAVFGADHITEDGLLYGEGKKREAVSPKGCRPVDLGYNVEESLPALLQYAVMEEDEEIYQKAKSALKTHLEFMLPDGAWDNSWGTRNNKWSYWGSRTSDGCQAGFGILAAEDAQCSEAFRRNTGLLRRCTKDGLLYGGPMFVSEEEPACVHHTFCHVKSLATFLHRKDTLQLPSSLPSDTRDGLHYYPSVHVGLIGTGGWRATVSDYDVEYSERGHATGGAVTLLWHKDLGPVFAGTMGDYQLVEPNNMQLTRNGEPKCQTPRISYQGEEGETYENINDLTAKVSYQEQPEQIRVQAEGVLRTGKQEGTCKFQVQYEFAEDKVCWNVTSCDHDAVFYLPVVSECTETVTADGNQLRIQRANGKTLCIQADARILVETDSYYKGRMFNPVGGMQALDCRIRLKKGVPVSIQMTEE